MIATVSPFPNSEFIRNQETWTSSVGYNVNYITLAGRFFFLLFVSMLIILRLHAGVSTIEPQPRAAIPFSAFADAVEEYEADSETDDEGDGMNA
jgi:hypothetical protein